MAKTKNERRIIAVAGAAALVAVGANLLISAINALNEKKKKKIKDLPGSNVRVNLSASDIHKLADQIIAKSKELFDQVASVPLEKVTYANVISPLTEIEALQFALVQSCILPRMVSTSNDARKASIEAEKKLDFHFSVCRKREDVYRAIKAFAAQGKSLDIEAKRYINCLVKEFECNGVNLTQSKRKEFESLKEKIDQLSLQYIHNLKKDESFVLLPESELLGLPSQFFKSLEKTDSGNLKILLKSHHVTPILEHCKIWATRKSVAIAYGQRCGKENLDILENLVQLRHKFARLLGYSSYSDFAVESRMVMTSTKVLEFLEDISISLDDLANGELDVLKDLKRQEEGDSPFGMEDLLYYMKRAEEQHSDLDFEEVQKYFSFDLVLSGVFKIFGDLFGLKFEEVKEVTVWHESVSIYSVFDLISSELLGYFYLDPFAREGKYAHTCVLALQNSCLLSDGTRQVPVALLLLQCPKQIDGEPVLLKFSDVVSLFHEFTHVVHHLCSRAKYSRFSALSVEADFVEVPGHLLENWCYEAIPLKMISGFHQDITKSVTNEMCESLRRRRNLFFGLKMKQELLLSLVDQIMHSSENADVIELLKHLHPKVMLGIPLLEGTNPASCFPRLAIGYEGTCYSYIWSEAIAADIFISKFQKNLLGQYEGLQFRNKVLESGGSKGSLDIISDYLGREPTVHSLIKRRYVLPA